MNFIGFDIETKGTLQEYALQAYRAPREQGWISAASLANSEKAVGTHNPSVKCIEGMLQTFTGQYVVCWNTCFDVSWLYAVGVSPSLIESIKWLDGMLLWMHLIREPEEEGKPRRSYSLAAAMKEYFPEDAGFKDFEDFQADSPEALKLLLHRNKEDARFTAILAEKFWTQLSPKQRQAAIIEARCIPMVAQTYNRGIRIDSEALGMLRLKLEDDAVNSYALLKEHYPAIDTVNLGDRKSVV